MASLPPEWRNLDRDCVLAPSPLDGNPWVDIELCKRFPILTSLPVEELCAVVLWLSLEQIFVLFRLLKLSSTAEGDKSARYITTGYCGSVVSLTRL